MWRKKGKPPLCGSARQSILPHRNVGASMRAISILCLMGALVLGQGSAAQASKLNTLYSFCAVTNCADGNRPNANLIADAQGNLYGTTSEGGANALSPVSEGGTVFELVRHGKRHARWSYRLLYSFCGLDVCADGATPLGGLIMDIAGNLYGTTESGGEFSDGTVFELLPGGVLTTLYSFCGQNDCKKTDGAGPTGVLTYAGAASGALYDGTSPLYGTTSAGGNFSTSGTVFQLAPESGSGKWKEVLLHAFCKVASCPDGAEPNGGLFMDGAGNLFGTTLLGSKRGVGALFELMPPSGDGKWKDKTVFDFCLDGVCAGGYEPMAGVTADASGALYGTTYFGGDTDQAGGVVYKIVLGGRKAHETVLHTYCNDDTCPDGDLSTAAVTLDGDGDVFAVASMGGAFGFGTILKLSPSGDVLDQVDFCALANCADGANPAAAVYRDSAGDLFGTTLRGGTHADDQGNGGTIYEVTP
jgi:uncharacterized repeat protein (TIGR03803 family)